MYKKAIQVLEECFAPFLNIYFIWHAASKNGIHLFKRIVINNRYYNIKGIFDNIL